VGVVLKKGSEKRMDHFKDEAPLIQNAAQKTCRGVLEVNEERDSQD